MIEEDTLDVNLWPTHRHTHTHTYKCKSQVLCFHEFGNFWDLEVCPGSAVPQTSKYPNVFEDGLGAWWWRPPERHRQKDLDSRLS